MVLQGRANAALTVVVGHIDDLGLQLAVDKSMVFKVQYGWADLKLRIGDQAYQLCVALKYLLRGHTRGQDDVLQDALPCQGRQGQVDASGRVRAGAKYRRSPSS